MIEKNLYDSKGNIIGKIVYDGDDSIIITVKSSDKFAKADKDNRGLNFADDILDGCIPVTSFDGMKKAWNIYNGKGKSIGYSIEYKDRIVYYYHTNTKHYEDVAYGDTLKDRIVYLYTNTDAPVAVIAKILGCSRLSIKRHTRGLR